MGHEGRLKRKQRREENRKSKSLLEIWNNNIVKFIEQQNRLNDRLKTVQQNQVIINNKINHLIMENMPIPIAENYIRMEGNVIGPETEVSEAKAESGVAELQTNEQVLEECTEEDTEGSGDSEPEGTVDDPESTPEA